MSIDYGVLDRAELSTPLFYPRPDRTPAPPGAVDHAIDVAPGVALSARHYAAPGSRATFLYFHGNGEVVSDHDDIAPLYHRLGIDLFVVDYRGYGRSGGRPTFATLVSDALPVAERFHALLDEQGHRGARFLMGRSLGSHPVLEIAARRPDRFRGLVLESAAANLRRLLGRLVTPVAAGVAEPLVAAHEAKIASITLPTLLLHGERDELIPLAHAAGVRDLLSTPDKTLVVIPGAGHNDILWRGGALYFGAIQKLVERL
jgi:pimeloyl-ACP methyl ester carboxylesterase